MKSPLLFHAPHSLRLFTLFTLLTLLVAACGQASPPAPTDVPTTAPVAEVPTQVPTEVPTQAPTEAPTEAPIEVPTEAPTEAPTTVADEPLPAERFLSAPLLQLPTADSVIVVWYTSFEGSDHQLTYTPQDGTPVTVAASSSRLPRLYEDADSRMRGVTFTELTEREVWRHEATATGLAPNTRVPYTVSSTTSDGTVLASDEFTLQPLPTTGTPLKILLTSDQQNRQMAAANFQKVVETVGLVDAVFFAGDFVDFPNRASEWFDRYDPAWLEQPGEAGQRAFAGARPAFFPSMQGYYQELFPEFPYNGGAILQHAPLFGSIGNHEVPGRWKPDTNTLNQMDNDPQPRWYAEMRYGQQQAEINPNNDPAVREQWIQDNSYEYSNYLAMWNHPDEGPQGEAYYAYQIGDVFLISMNVSRMWRTWEVKPESRGKFSERRDELSNPDAWGFGDMWFETFNEGSEQYEWLREVLASEAFQNARYRMVMAHQSPFGVGDNVIPVMADPVATIFYTDAAGITQTLQATLPFTPEQWQETVMPLLGSITEIRYEYPLENDVWRNDIEPLLVESGVDLVLTGHSHLWNRAQVGAMHYLETSNVGNTFGGYYADDGGIVSERADYVETFWAELESPTSRWNPINYPRTGDGHGRAPIFPTEFNPMAELEPLAENNRPLPYLSSNNLTAFSILETGTGVVSSYVFDTRNPASEVRLFDQFTLGE